MRHTPSHLRDTVDEVALDLRSGAHLVILHPFGDGDILLPAGRLQEGTLLGGSQRWTGGRLAELSFCNVRRSANRLSRDAVPP